MKKLLLSGILVFLALCAVALWTANAKQKVAYADFDCPVCGSDEVLDFGERELGQKYHCYDCKAEFYIKERKP